jgi:hypothetical protein
MKKIMMIIIIIKITIKFNNKIIKIIKIIIILLILNNWLVTKKI